LITLPLCYSLNAVDTSLALHEVPAGVDPYAVDHG
jgi:hypothetical protein